jgi:hypothetical protein
MLISAQNAIPSLPANRSLLTPKAGLKSLKRNTQRSSETKRETRFMFI